VPNAEAFDLVHGSEVVGRLIVATDTPEAGLHTGDRLLLEDLSSQLAVAAYALRQTAALERARQKLVTQREEDRARLRRDHHDGVKPAISGVICEIDAILNMCEAPGSPRAFEQITHQAASVKGKVARIRADLRRMIDSQGPRSVDELGLAGAVRLHVSTLGLGPCPLVVVVRAPEELSGLPTEVEVGAFFIVSEAVENVRKHAGATRCIVTMGIGNGRLEVEVSDDGHGLGRQVPQGMGMSSMAARAEDLEGELFVGPSPEGGTLIRVLLPLPLGTPS
jgi:signal transduction histidine kinase